MDRGPITLGSPSLGPGNHDAWLPSALLDASCGLDHQRQVLPRRKPADEQVIGFRYESVGRKQLVGFVLVRVDGKLLGVEAVGGNDDPRAVRVERSNQLVR